MERELANWSTSCPNESAPLIFIAANLTKRVAKHVLKEVTGRTLFRRCPDDPAALDTVMRTPQIGDVEAALHSRGILALQRGQKDLRGRLLRQFPTIGLRNQRLDCARKPKIVQVPQDLLVDVTGYVFSKRYVWKK